MKRVLIISPHFPPDTSAGTHRVRLLAPHLPKYGWEPTVVSVDPRDYEGRLDEELASLVPSTLRVIRCRAWSAHWTRLSGIGDVGLRAFMGLFNTCSALLRNEIFNALFITIYPSYPALLGPLLKRKYGVPFVLDYQDPWVGAWGKTVGSGQNGVPDFKSRMTRALASRLEPLAARAANAITAVSSGTFQEVVARNPELAETPCEAIPIGGEAADFETLRLQPRPNKFFDAQDGRFHLCYVGTLLPMGFETLRAILKATKLLRERRANLYAMLQLNFFGTSNQTSAIAPERVLPIARALGVEDCVAEVAPRIDYLDALTIQTQASAIMMMGSTEHHYTASKLYPGLLAQRPMLTIYHEASSVVEILRRSTRPPTVQVITYNDELRAESRVEDIYIALCQLIESRGYDPNDIRMQEVKRFSAESLAGKLAQTLDQVTRAGEAL